jgi:nitrogen fixation protein NifQ
MESAETFLLSPFAAEAESDARMSDPAFAVTTAPGENLALNSFSAEAEADARTNAGTATYRMLMDCDPADAVIGDDANFDRHVFASILAVSAMQGAGVGERAGLAPDDLSALLACEFPAVRDVAAAWSEPASRAEDDEIAMVRDLLLANRSNECDASRWLAAMIARRSLEPNHLWEDLGLRDRSELSRLLTRHFAPLADRNVNNMRWKRFFYRALCEDDGLVMCSTPVCSQCGDFDLCFGDESGESLLAYQRRALALKVSSFTELDGEAPPASEATLATSHP